VVTTDDVEGEDPMRDLLRDIMMKAGVEQWLVKEVECEGEQGDVELGHEPSLNSCLHHDISQQISHWVFALDVVCSHHLFNAVANKARGLLSRPTCNLLS
jgi:hypothetical protein